MADATADFRKSIIPRTACQPDWSCLFEVEYITKLVAKIT